MSRKARFGYSLDVAALLAFVGVAASGFALSAGREDGARLETGVVELHQALATLLILLVSLHFALHYRWFVTMTRRVVNR